MKDLNNYMSMLAQAKEDFVFTPDSPDEQGVIWHEIRRTYGNGDVIIARFECDGKLHEIKVERGA